MMIKLPLLIILSLLPVILFGQFAPAVRIAPNSLEVHSVKEGDYDSDGDIDVMAYSAADGKLMWYENNGSGVFNNYHLVIDSLPNYRLITGADYNQDGAADLVITWPQNSNTRAWVMLNNGAGSFSTASLQVPYDLYSEHLLKSTDMDQDGLTDIVIADVDGKAWWYKNTGSGVFSLPDTIPVPAGLQVVRIDDLNGDGFEDVFLFSSNPYLLYCLVNDGNGDTFTLDTLYSNVEKKVYGVGDFDGDGDRDLLSERHVVGASTDIIWIVNDGTGNFSNHYNLPYFNTHLGTAISVFDFDGIAGDEIVSNGSPFVAYHLTGLTTVTPDTIAPFTGGAYNIIFADFNGDGTDDVLFDIPLMILMGSGNTDDWLVASHMNTPEYVRTLALADLDKDNDLDLVTLSHAY